MEHYHTVSKILHWMTALIILGLLSLGFYMVGLDFSEDKLKLYALHKSFGLLVLLLVFVRVVWHVIKRKPRSLPTHKVWEKALSHAAHMFLYFAMFALPLSGWVMSSAGDFNVQFFGIEMPDLVAKNEEIFKNAGKAHEILALILVVVIGLHMAGAFKHHFIDRDATLSRMSSDKVGLGGGVLLAAFAGLLFLPPVVFVAREVLHEISEEESDGANVPQEFAERVEGVSSNITSDATRWVMDAEKSYIKFEATQYGQTFEGEFKGFTGQIFFDPEKPEQGKVLIEIDIGTIKTGSDDRDKQAVSAEWFDVQVHPRAVFEASSFTENGAGQYIAHGTLTVRGASVSVELPFSLSIEEKDARREARMEAQIILKRLDFGVGQGQWQSTDTIGGDVKIKIRVEATAG